jgi:SAM-dependent methyltransferase
MKIDRLYLEETYLEKNPNWHRTDSQWKANLVENLLKKHQIEAKSICDVGCGSGDVLRCLQSKFPKAHMIGYDVSSHAKQYWTSENDNIIEINGTHPITFKLADFHQNNTERYDVLLMLDVFEHVHDPFFFLEEARQHADKFVFHIPLDLSASSVLRGQPLLNARSTVGHLHFYTKDLALDTLIRCGYDIIDWSYTGAALNGPSRGLVTKLAKLPRRLIYSMFKDWGVRLIGGETLIVLAE